ncbi:MAG: hypothetical protein J5515_08055, partial [Lachnospiraceae bacterium]|nr:hypothetical protein [Lachnospiraceae bacterium]
MSVKETLKKFIPEKVLLTRALIIYRHRVKTVLKDRKREKFAPAEFKKGVNLIGPLKAQMGLGQSCRLLARAIKASGTDYTFRNFDLIGNVQNGDTSFDSEFSKDTPYGI